MTDHSNPDPNDRAFPLGNPIRHFDHIKTAFQDQSDQAQEDEDGSKPMPRLDEEPNGTVTKEKYNKLKRRFSALREVSAYIEAHLSAYTARS